MGRVIGRLTAQKALKVREPGYYADGGGLYLQVTEGGASWVYRYMLNGKAREMGLGPRLLYGLAEARSKALDARRLRHEGIDPIEAKRQARLRMRLDAAKAVTFKDAAERYIAAHKAGWRNGKHGDQWRNTLATYAEPIIGSLPVQAIDTALVLKVLEPIWTEKSETASRVRGRIESVLDWAKVRGYREGENPARWRGHLDKLLPASAKVRRVEHHPALPYTEIGGFIAALRHQEGTAARALEFTILTAARTGETIGATWAEINMADKMWTISATRMKAGREHRVPLGPRAIEIIENMREIAGKDATSEAFVFPGAKRGQPLSNMAFLMLLRRMGRDDVTAHGFRSSFRDWCSDRTSFPAELAEAALAHVAGDKTASAYARSDLFQRRRRMMTTWATYCATQKQEGDGTVTTLRKGTPITGAA